MNIAQALGMHSGRKAVSAVRLYIWVACLEYAWQCDESKAKYQCEGLFSFTVMTGISNLGLLILHT